MSEPRQQLLALADDCQERARRSRNGDARSLYWGAVNRMRQACAARYSSEQSLRGELLAMEAQAQLARWYDGGIDEYDPAREAVTAHSCAKEDLKAAQATSSRQGALTRAGDRSRPLNARQLASKAGMSERGALKRIVHGFHRRLPGFYREGRRWFADHDAFEQFRMSSD